MSEVNLYEHFPKSFAVLCCPLFGCTVDTPYYDPMKLIAHLADSHAVVVENPKTVLPFLEAYLREFPSTPAEDMALRLRLQQSKLEEMLRIQEYERQSLYPLPRVCLWCPEEYPNLPALFQHMYHDHGFNCGHLNNLVMVGEYMAILETLLSQSICIYCEKAYQNRTNLRKHLKAKGHVRINPNNHAYDRYYINNYILNHGSEVDQPEESGDWEDLSVPIQEEAMCLFCEQVCLDPEDAFAHMLSLHKFELDFEDDYDRIKAINYLRYCQREVQCPSCREEFENLLDLQAHIDTIGHAHLPADDEWRQPQYLFPTYDDDPLLMSFT